MLLQTKFQPPPIRVNIIYRARLTQLLDRGRHCKVTLVSAPAGYGKTTLVTSWLKSEDMPLAWLSLDEYDNDPSRFLRYLTAALTKVDTRIGQSVHESLEGMQVGSPIQSSEGIFTGLINDLLSLEEDLFVVLDDVHHIENQALLQGLSFWIDHLPPHVHLILISRTVPKLPIPRLRVRGHLIEITNQELQFSPDEAVAFFRDVMDLDLDPRSVTTLVERTEGWIASLQLAALSLQGHDQPDRWVARFTGRDRQLVDYLLSEVFEQQPPDIQDFLLYTALTDRLSPTLAVELTGQSKAHQFLDQLEQRNLFIVRLDDEHSSYRYHPLFADFLRLRFRQAEPESYRKMQEKVSVWFESQEMIDEAITHALEAESWGRAATLLADNGPKLIWEEGRPTVYINWCERIPFENLIESPFTALMLGWAYVFYGRFPELKNHLTSLAERYGDYTDPAVSDLKGSICILNGELAVWAGDITGALTYFSEAMDLLPAEFKAPRAIARQVQGYAYRLNGDIEMAKEALSEADRLADETLNLSLRLFAGCDLAETWLIAGKPKAAEAAVNRTLGHFPEAQRENLAMLNLAYIVLGRAFLMQNRLREAEESFDRAIAFFDINVTPGPVNRYGYSQMAFLKLAQGDQKTAQKLMKRVEKAARHTNNQNTIAVMNTRLSNFLLRLNEPEKITYWQIPQTHQLPRYQAHEANVAFARYQVITRQGDAEPLLNQLATTAENEGWCLLAIEAHILLAILHQQKNHLDHALTHLKTAVEIAEPEQIIRPFIDEGEPMVRLLRLAMSRNMMPKFIGTLQAAFLPALTATQPLLDPLTQREQEVLGHMANGHSNPEIAREMIVATGTVAKYTNNIYSKLGVRNRTEAVTRAKQLSLIE
ncbi:MAG: LuxR C-terminal-related transcriptional regulator [Ardenticatenaceae bacterium]|nr:LuxR C-terminal-related transcriptional regulator [Ardenticatenaceae bacterium]